MPEVAIVTGGTGAIGSAICAEFGSGGRTVVAADRDVHPVPKGQHFQLCDVTDPKSVAELFDQAARLGTVTRVVAAHGILMETPAGATDPAALSTVLDVNLKGVAYLCDACGTRLGRGAAIVLLSSVTAFMGRARNGYAYQASKGGVESLTRAFAVAYGPKGIRVNCIAPGFMSIPMKGQGAQLRERQGGGETVVKSTPLGRLVEPAEIAKAAAFLCSPSADAITGIVLPVDCGLRAY
jgi:3-oxoacyl-[acyl-carrier protein] reductase